MSRTLFNGGQIKDGTVTQSDLDPSISLGGNLSQILALGNSAGAYEINMNANKITTIGTPSSSGDASNKYYSDLAMPAGGHFGTQGEWTKGANQSDAGRWIARISKTVKYCHLQLGNTTSTPSVMVALYADAGVGAPGALLMNSTQVTLSSADAYCQILLTLPVGVALTQGTHYWTAVNVSANTNIYYAIAANSSSGAYKAQAYGSFADPFGASTGAQYVPSAYWF